MNFFNLVCNKCENCNENEILLNYNKKSSKNSLINHKVDIPKDEIISNDSTNNLEIIDYPYAINFNQGFIPNLSQKNNNLKQPQSNYYINKVNKIKNLPTDQLDNSNIKSNSKNNSLSSSSLIVKNEDNFLQNKVLLTNYYENYENNKKKEIQKKIIPYKKIIKDINNNFCNRRSERTNKKFEEKTDVIIKRVAESFSAKKNNKSNSQILNMKNNNKKIKIMKTEFGDYQKIKKSKTNFIIRNRSNKTRKNIILKNNLIKEKFLRKNIYITYNKNNNKNPLNKLKKINNQNKSKYKKSFNKFDKKIYFFILK